MNIIAQNTSHPKYLMIMFHGVGSNGQDLIELAPYFQKELPDIYFYSPNGIEKYDFSNFGYQWFSLQNRNPEIIRRLMFNNASKIKNLIDTKLSELKLSYDNLIFLGFSQGTTISIFLALSGIITPKYLIGFSGFPIDPENNNNNNNFKACIIHGEEDSIVSHDYLSLTEKLMEKYNIIHETHSIEKIDHTIDMNGIQHAINFLKKQIK